VAAEVYQDLGEYGAVMPQWLVQPGVLGWIDEDNDERRGFAVLGFYQDRTTARTVADLLAIGVVPRYQRSGIGTRLLEHVIGVVSAVAPTHSIPDLRLTVSHTNVVGQRWYARSGFRVVDGEHGTYANGQRAIRMARPLSPG
jgi:ribosomal protein S18 acetylase RimI-like enzyme